MPLSGGRPRSAAPRSAPIYRGETRSTRTPATCPMQVTPTARCSLRRSPARARELHLHEGQHAVGDPPDSFRRGRSRISTDPVSAQQFRAIAGIILSVRRSAKLSATCGLLLICILPSACEGSGRARTATPVAPSSIASTTTPVAPGSSTSVPLLHLRTGLYWGVIQSVDPATSQMLFTITGSCGTPSSATWRIDFSSATFEINTQPITEQGETIAISKADWIMQAESWKDWHVLVLPSGGLDISNGPSGACHGAYTFLP